MEDAISIILKRINILPSIEIPLINGIGKTLEDELGIPENNIQGPDGEATEVKGARKNSSSNLSLFTKILGPIPQSIAKMTVNLNIRWINNIDKYSSYYQTNT